MHKLISELTRLYRSTSNSNTSMRTAARSR